MPVVRSASGGRPRLYCSDAHRAEARRRRLGGAPAAPAPDDPLGAVRRLLFEASAQLDAAPRLPSYDAVLAEARAQATAEVLRAQQAAADALRRAASAEERLAEEGARWAETLREREASLEAQVRRAAELEHALGGARDALESELIAHHEDVHALQAALETHRAVHEAACRSWEAELGEWQGAEAQARAALDAADERARRAEADAADAHGRARAAAARAAACDRQTTEAARRAQEAERRAGESDAAAAQLRQELAAVTAERDAARRERSGLLVELRRRDVSARRARNAAAGAPGQRRIRTVRRTS